VKRQRGLRACLVVTCYIQNGIAMSPRVKLECTSRLSGPIGGREVIQDALYVVLKKTWHVGKTTP
jgi:hypothetical protein